MTEAHGGASCSPERREQKKKKKSKINANSKMSCSNLLHPFVEIGFVGETHTY
jgi:hypothetical protein